MRRFASGVLALSLFAVLIGAALVKTALAQCATSAYITSPTNGAKFKWTASVSVQGQYYGPQGPLTLGAFQNGVQIQSASATESSYPPLFSGSLTPPSNGAGGHSWPTDIQTMIEVYCGSNQYNAVFITFVAET